VNRYTARSRPQRQDARGDEPGKNRGTGGEGTDAADPTRAGGLQDAPGPQEQGALGQSVAQHVQQHRGHRQRTAHRDAEGEQPHVLDAGVGEQPSVVALGQQQRGGHQ
jgi:hypothetical protein